MTLMDVRLVVAEYYEAKLTAGRALDDHFPEGSTLTVLTGEEGEATFWEVEEVDWDTLRIKAKRADGGALPLRASFPVSRILRSTAP